MGQAGTQIILCDAEGFAGVLTAGELSDCMPDCKYRFLDFWLMPVFCAVAAALHGT